MTVLNYSTITKIVQAHRLIEQILQAIPPDERDRKSRGVPFNSERGRAAVLKRHRRTSLERAVRKLAE